MSFIYLLIVLLAAAAVISLAFSFLGILLVGALRLLPLVFVALLLFVIFYILRYGSFGGRN